MAIFMPLEYHFFNIILKDYNFLRFESQLKKLNCSVLPLLSGQGQNMFKILRFWAKFCDLNLAGEPRYSASCNIFTSNLLEDLPWRFLFCYEGKQL